MSGKRTPEELARKPSPARSSPPSRAWSRPSKRETEKLRAVDIYLNDEGKRRLRACETIKFLTGFYEITIGGKSETPKCRKNKSRQHRLAFEMAVLTNKLGFPDDVIMEATEEPKQKG